MRVLTTRRTQHPKVVEAWREYLEACRDARLRGVLTVEEVEQWAWTRLRETLKQIQQTQ